LLQIHGEQSAGAATVKLQTLKQEMASISKLSNKVRDLETNLADREEELKLLKRLVPAYLTVYMLSYLNYARLQFNEIYANQRVAN
jgi:hypothetical protein